MYHQSYLDSLDSVEYEQFLFWDGQIPNNPDKPLDPEPQKEYNTPMENENFNDNLEIGGDLQDEYQAIQEAEAGVEPEMASDKEIKDLLMEMWEEIYDPVIGSLSPDKEYTEEDAFRDYMDTQEEDFN